MEARHRSRERAFREAHRETLRQFAGQWVVLEGEVIVAHGKDPAWVVAVARARGINTPYVFYVEETREDEVWIGL